MVRLKAAVRERHRIVSLMFQFHNGSIKSNTLLNAIFHESEFQFHNGSIKRDFRMFRFLFCFSFNSTMVRLKVIQHEYPPIRGEWFQFHNGSIKRYWCATRRVSNFSFQFHNGSIKSKENNQVAFDLFCFNSTMVRLKVKFIINLLSFCYVSIPQWFD